MLSFFVVMGGFLRALWSALRDAEFRALFTLTGLTLLSGAFFYWRVEGWGFFDSLYFSVITLTTVGYGDFSPVTVAGRTFTIVYIFLGIGILLGFINAIAERSTTRGTPFRQPPDETQTP